MNTKIAVVGLGGLFPGAKNPDEFWKNIAAGKVSIGPLPEEKFEREVFYRPDLLTALNKDDKSTTDIAGWIDDLQFDTVRKYRIPPSVAEHMDTNQHAALYTAAQALESNTLRNVPNDRVAVVFGNGMVGTRYGDAMFRVQFQLMEHYLRKHPGFQNLTASQQEEVIRDVRENVLRDTIPISEDSAPGVLPNIIAARIASVYDFHGPSFTVDAACASALAAVMSGIQGLTLNEYDAVICGGSDMPLKQLGFVLFSALNALSPDGSYPFDRRADGFVMSQGAGAMILKRLDEAVAQNDTIYAVITGYGASSDGRGKYIAAPNPDWQAHAIEKACRMAGYPVDTIEMIEAHGTATRVGDVVEVAALKQAFGNLGATRANYCGLTSVKSNIGHLKSAAGIAGLLKAILALHHKMLPPTASFEVINPRLELDGSPFYVLDRLREWDGNAQYPRRANVSSFGFGGADYHVALEEYRPSDYRKPLHTGFALQTASEKTGAGVAPGAAAGDSEAIFLSADAPGELAQTARMFASALQEHPSIPFSEFSALWNYRADPRKTCRLGLLASSPEELASKVEFFTAAGGGIDQAQLRLRGLYYRKGVRKTPGETAILFPGQASQYVEMFRWLVDSYDSIRSIFRRADAHWLVRRNHTVSSLLFPQGGKQEDALERLRQTENAHPAIFVSSIALYDFLNRSGLSARTMIGHSLGEITALAASGMVSFEDALKLVEERGYAFVEERLPDRGKMVSVAGSVDDARRHIAESGLAVTIANINGPNQVIVAGGSEAVDRFKDHLDRNRINNTVLFVSHAFHTPLLRSVADRYLGKIQEIPFRASGIRVAMNHAAAYYPQNESSLATIPQMLREQIVSPVDFKASVEKLYGDGIRLFVEVGPGAVLSNLVSGILEGREATVLASNHRSVDDRTSLLRLTAALFAEGVPLHLPPARSTAERPIEVTPARENGSLQPSLPAREKGFVRSGPVEPAGAIPAQVVYSGAAIGLPGSYKESFRDDNFEQIFEGRNQIERLTDEEKRRLVDLQITMLIKDENGPAFKLLSTLDDVIQLAGKIGRIDMVRDYHLDEKTVQNMSSSIAHGVAAGYEALKDARIPLVREYSRTSTGRLLPQKLALPPGMQDETGVIFANGFPLIDPVIQEVSRSLAHAYGFRTRKELMSFYESLIGRIKDQEAKKLLTDWYVLYYSRLSDHPGEEEVYRFNHHFMTQISAQANNLLATLINARGPNFQLNAACSSTSNAITIAEDFIRSGRVRRMIVVGADDATSKTNFPYLGAGFLCTGAATNEGDLYRAAVPFDRRRNGMITGAGAVGIVLEAREEAARRGVDPICDLLGTHSFNTARHISQIDPEVFARELEKFIGRMEQEHGLQREEMAGQTVYISHETCTPPRGGCSQTEAAALKRAFGMAFSRIIVGNTKGMTGHTMGASIEDAVAAKALQHGLCPPVVNFSQPDPLLEGLNLWRGGAHTRTFALKMSAGFGSQGHFALLRKSCSGENRITDRKRYDAWLAEITGTGQAVTEQWGRLLRIREDSAASAGNAASSDQIQPGSDQVVPVAPPGGSATIPAPIILDLLADVSGYPPEMLEPEMEFRADLALDSTKMTEIEGRVCDRFGIPRGALVLSGSATVQDLINQVQRLANGGPGESTSADGERASRTGSAGPVPLVPSTERSRSTSSGGAHTQVSSPAPSPLHGGASGQPHPPKGAAGPAATGGLAGGAKEAITAVALGVFSEVTKYPREMLDLDMNLEADLGIDTVKQATILSILGEKYRLDRQEGMQLSSYQTIRSIVDMICEKGDGVEIGAGGISREATAPSETMAREIDRDATEIAAGRILDRETVPADVAAARILDHGTVPGEKFEEGTAAARPGAEVDFHEGPGPAAGNVPSSPLSRQVPFLSEEPLATARTDVRGKNIWVLGDHDALASQIASELTRRGAQVSVFVFPGAASPGGVEGAISAFADGRTADVIIDTTHAFGGVANPERYNGAGGGELDRMLFLSAEARFVFYRFLSGRTKHPSKIICLTAIDGSFGMDPARSMVTEPTFGALAGFYKALRKEWSGCDVRILDFAPEALGRSFPECFEQLLAEVEHGGHGVEVAYPHGRRMVVKIREGDPGGSRTLTFGPADTFLITGGGSGIASRIVAALARSYRPKFIIVGRTTLPGNIEELASLDEAGLERERERLDERLRGEHPKVTPAMLAREFGKIMQALEVHRTLRETRELGSEVVYVPCDVRDEDSLRSSLDRARKVAGPITAIVHAAGIDRSRMMDQKSVEEFRDVFSVKAKGAVTLLSLCANDPLRLVVAFSSISGRFGNAAQLDYSAANGFLNNWIRTIPVIRPGVRAVSLVWSGWKDVGIAWRNEIVRRKSEELGLNLIDVEQGVAAFLEEITRSDGAPEVILHRGLDGFIERGLATFDPAGSPLIDRVTSKGEAIDRGYRIFSPRRDALIDQHRLGKIPILPAVAYAELAVEYYALRAGRKEQYLLRKMKFPNAFKLFRGEPRELFVEGREEAGRWSIDIKSSFRPPRAPEAQVILHSSVTVSGGPIDTVGMDLEKWTYLRGSPTSLPAEDSLLLIKGEGPEQRIVLGPLFNDVLRDPKGKVPVLIYPEGTTYPAYFPMEQLTSDRYPMARMHVNPCFLDSLYQACAAHLLVNRKRVYLPWEIGELGIVRVPRQPGMYRCHAQVVGESADTVAFDVAMVDGQGALCYFARNARFKLINL